VRIEVGYGLEPDLTDSQAGRIIRDRIIPLFKEGKMADGLVAGVAGILGELGAAPYEARAEERKRAEEARRIAAERTAENLKTILVFAGIFGTIILTVVFAVRAIRRHAEWKRKLQNLHKDNEKMLKETGAKIDEAGSEYAPAKELLDRMKLENPKEVWSDLDKALELVPEKIRSMCAVYVKAKAFQDKGWRSAEEARGFVLKLHEDALTYSSIYELVKAKSEEVDKAKRKSEELLKSLPGSIKKAWVELEHPDVGGEAKDILKDAERKFTGTGSMLKLPAPQMVNWLTVYAFLSGALALASNAVSTANRNKADAERARKEGPQLLEKMPKLIKEADGAVSDSDVSSSTKQKVGEAKTKYSKAKLLAGQSHIDWLSAFALLTAAAALLQTAISNASSEKSDAERARRRRRESSSDSVPGGYSSSSWSSGSSDFGGSFGGFGGGSFGGGGASGSW